MNADSANPPVARKYGSISWAAADLIFTVIVPLSLSACFVTGFGRESGPDVSPYPWPYPAWAFGITLLKVAAMVTWLCLRDRAAGHLPAVRGLVGGVFLVGGLHATACGLFNAKYAAQGLSVAALVALAFLAGLFYFRSFGRTCRRTASEPALSPIDLVLGVTIALVLPGAAELLLVGRL